MYVAEDDKEKANHQVILLKGNLFRWDIRIELVRACSLGKVGFKSSKALISGFFQI